MFAPEFGRAEGTRVDKPWGYELRWAITDRYVGKVLHINKGEALSLQFHEAVSYTHLTLPTIYSV